MSGATNPPGENSESRGRSHIPNPDPADLDAPSGSWLSVLAEFLHLRLALLGIEVREAKKGLLLGAILIFSGAFFFLLSWAGIWVALAAIISRKFHQPWPQVVLGVAILHAIGGVILFLIGKKCFSKTNFRDSLKEFQRDGEWLAQYRKHKQSPKNE